MDPATTVDIFATKGVEYLLVIGYLVLLVPFLILLRRLGAAPRPAQAVAHSRWFSAPDGFWFHQGHAWAAPEAGDVVRVGMDDFARKLVGAPAEIALPESGARLEAGEAAWELRWDGQGIEMLAPVRGEVVEVNEKLRASPALVAEDPYGEGWLLKVRVPRAGAALNNLLAGPAARAFMDVAAGELRHRMGGALGDLLQDGGAPVSGFARQLAPGAWRELAAELLLTLPARTK